MSIETEVRELVNQQQQRDINAPKQPVLGLISGLFINLALTGIKVAIEQIKDPHARALSAEAVTLLSDLAKLLTDSDKDNAQQIADYFHANWQAIAKRITIVIEALIQDKMKAGRMKELVLLGLSQVVANL